MVRVLVCVWKACEACKSCKTCSICRNILRLLAEAISPGRPPVCMAFTVNCCRCLTLMGPYGARVTGAAGRAMRKE